MHFSTLDLCQTCGQDNPLELKSLKMLLLEPIAKLAYLSHPGGSRGPEYLENTGYRLYEHEASLSTV
jgi:hypothetical protein